MPAKCTDILVLCWIEAHPGLAGYVQAAGAVVAILVSIKFARDSALREGAAQAAAIQREREADEAAARRVEQADRAAEERIKRAEAARHNAIIDRITALGVLAFEQCKENIDDLAAANAGSGSTFIASLGSPRLKELRDALPALREQTGDTSLLEGIARLADATVPRQITAPGIDAAVSDLRAQLDIIAGVLTEIEGERLP